MGSGSHNHVHNQNGDQDGCRFEEPADYVFRVDDVEADFLEEHRWFSPYYDLKFLAR
jgi:hypothetical protein